MSLIATHALLHQAQRAQDEQGRGLATLEDYAVLYDLVVDLVSEGVGVSVSKTMRQTVEAVRALGSASHSMTAIAKQLRLHKTTTAHRVNEAVEAGHLTNEETRKGFPAKIKLGDPLPEQQQVLPAPEKLNTRTVGV